MTTDELIADLLETVSFDKPGGDWRALGGPGSGNFGHAGRPGEVGGSSPATNANGQVVEEGGNWHRTRDGEEPYGYHIRGGDDYQVPEIKHKVVRDGGLWGSSHGNSQMMTGYAAGFMGIPGYSGRGSMNAQGNNAVEKFLTEISNDAEGSEELLHHAFANVRGTDFKVGDTLRLPLTATAGDVGGYGTRLEAEDQQGQPTVFEFEKGTQMVAYSPAMTKRDAADMGYDSLEAGYKDTGHIWSEALVAGGFEVLDVKTKYFGSQHSRTNPPGSISQIYGKVVRLKQRETFDMNSKKWVPRG